MTDLSHLQDLIKRLEQNEASKIATMEIEELATLLTQIKGDLPQARAQINDVLDKLTAQKQK